MSELQFYQTEIKLYEAFNNIEEDVHQALNKKEYDKALDIFIALKGPVDNFFDEVMVMVEDSSIRENRLALLAKISETMLLICDLSKLVRQ